jgi:hypothetical protein
VDRSAFHGSTLYIAQRTWKIDTSRSKSKTDITHPTLSRYLRQSDTPLMQTNITHTAEYDKVVVSIVSISTDLALCILKLSLTFLLLSFNLSTSNLLAVQSLSIGLHVLEVSLLFGVKLIDELKWILRGKGHKRGADLGELSSGEAGLKNTNNLIDGHMKNAVKKELLNTLFL